MSARLVSAALALALAAGACGTKDVIVAYESEAGTRPCAGAGDCAPDDVCAKASCSSPEGVCERRPAFCPDDGAPVCGCDGVTYWNDCLRRQARIAAGSQGACPPGLFAPCGGAPYVPCLDPRASCARLLPPGPCPPDAKGSCWILPPTCASSQPVWMPCGPQMQCADTCTAIRSGMPYRTASQGCP